MSETEPEGGATASGANPTAEGSGVPADGPAGTPGDDPARPARHEVVLEGESLRKVEEAPPAVLRGREGKVDPSDAPP